MSENEVPAPESGTPKSGGGNTFRLVMTLGPAIVALIVFIAVYVTKKQMAWSPLVIMITMLGLITILPATKRREGEDEITFYSHSQLFYFWPVWLVSFIFADLSKIFGTSVTLNIKVGGKVLEAKTMMSQSPGLGLTYLIILLVVIFFTSVNLRGVWAVVFGACAVILGLGFYVLRLWGPILKALGGFRMFVNYDFYLAVGVLLFVPWLLVVFLFDRRRYISLRPTQITMVNEVGEGQKNFDTVGMFFEKKRDNFFQHLILGMGSGDLQITTSGGQRDQIVFHNVMTVGVVLDEITRIRERRGR
jgi:hypothetical protein